MSDPNQPSPGGSDPADASTSPTPPEVTPPTPPPPPISWGTPAPPPPPTSWTTTDPAPTEPVPVGWSDQNLAPPQGSGPPPPGYAPPPPGYAPLPPPPTHWEMPSGLPPGSGPAPGYVYVGFWRRFAATFIDGILFFFLYWILFAIFLSRIDSSSWRVFLDLDANGRPLATNAEILGATRELLGLWLGLVALVWLVHIVYHVVFWAWFGGTLGQLALGIQVRRESDGRRIGLGTSIVRYIGYLISLWVIYIGFIWAAFDRRKQGWHDKIAGTLVIRRVD